MTKACAYIGADIFDGTTRHKNCALLVENGHVVGIKPEREAAGEVHQLAGGLLTAGFVDVQVNGGGGVMLNSAPTLETIKTIRDAHLPFGTTSLLPTLITDTPARTALAREVAVAAIAIEGVIGLHLEGPHLSVARKGAHDPTLIRPMTAEDLSDLCTLAAKLPSLLVTVAPESTTPAQIAALRAAGAVVSLGHTDADFATARAAGATCVTHLFNAMSQLGNRAPGVVGAALESGEMFAGLIADGIHVNPETIKIALRAKQGPGRVFLVTDAMATIGTDLTELHLGERVIYRKNGRLTLEDGTLAGADLDMISAVRFMVNRIGVPVEEALRMASLYPAQLLGRAAEIGQLASGNRADFIHLDAELDIQDIWRGGRPVMRG